MEENFTSAEKKGVVAAASKAWQKIVDTLNKGSDKHLSFNVDKKSVVEHYRVRRWPVSSQTPW